MREEKPDNCRQPSNIAESEESFSPFQSGLAVLNVLAQCILSEQALKKCHGQIDGAAEQCFEMGKSMLQCTCPPPVDKKATELQAAPKTPHLE